MAIIPNETIADFLNTPLIMNNFISLDLWSIIHFISGFLLMWIIIKLIKNKFIQMILFVLILILYEYFEILYYGILFRPEPIINILWDIIVGISGGVIYLFLSKK